MEIPTPKTSMGQHSLVVAAFAASQEPGTVCIGSFDMNEALWIHKAYSTYCTVADGSGESRGPGTDPWILGEGGSVT